MSTLNLSTLNSDFDSIKAQLQLYLTNKDSWKGLLTTETGQTILEMAAAIGAYDSLKIQRSFEDAFPETAVSDEAIYAGAVMQGVRILRKQPASVTCTVTSTTTQSIGAYSQFLGAGNYLFNRQAISLIANTPQTVTLWQGQVQNIAISGLGTDYQMFFSQERGFQVSNTDVTVAINDVPITRTESGMWKLKGASGFHDRTLPDGRLVIEFGNFSYGSRPSQTDSVAIMYVVTSGAAANNLNIAGRKFQVSGYSNVTVTATGNPVSGADEQSPLVYKNVSSATFGNFGAAVIKEQYQATAASYPGVVDAIVQAQRDINPTALQWMNTMRVTLLTTTAWSAPQSQAYLNWLQANTMYSGRFILAAPSGVSTSVSLVIYVFNWANPTQAQADATAAVQALFAQQPGYLGKDITLNDIYDKVKSSNKGIDFVELYSPTADMIVSNTAVDAPGFTILPTGGTLAAGMYIYAVSLVTAYGNIAPRNWITVTIPSGTTNRIQLDWAARPDAQYYTVYGRGVPSGTYGRLADTVGNANTFIDNGSYAPTGTVPAFSTAPIRYNLLAGVAVQVKYTTRNTRIG